MGATWSNQLQALSLGALLCACGSASEANAGDPDASAPAAPPAYYCKEWPDAAGLCDGPTLDAEDAAAQIPRRYKLKGNERLVAIESSNGGGFAPDGRQILTGDGWSFLYDIGGGLSEWLTVRANPIDRIPVQYSCPHGQVTANGITQLVQDASELMRSQYAASFEPGTFFTWVRRETDCESALTRTVVKFRFMSTTNYHELTVEFDDTGALVGSCDTVSLMLGCP